MSVQQEGARACDRTNARVLLREHATSRQVIALRTARSKTKKKGPSQSVPAAGLAHRRRLAQLRSQAAQASRHGILVIEALGQHSEEPTPFKNHPAWARMRLQVRTQRSAAARAAAPPGRPGAPTRRRGACSGARSAPRGAPSRAPARPVRPPAAAQRAAPPPPCLRAVARVMGRDQVLSSVIYLLQRFILFPNTAQHICAQCVSF